MVVVGQGVSMARWALKVVMREVESMACWVQCRVWGTVAAAEEAEAKEGDNCRSRQADRR